MGYIILFFTDYFLATSLVLFVCFFYFTADTLSLKDSYSF